MIDVKKIQILEGSLSSNGKEMYAEWLRHCMAAASGTKIAVTGEAMRGKSTFINKLLGEKVMPVSVIPTECPIRIVPAAPGEIPGNYSEDGQVLEEAAWEDALEEDRPLMIKTNNEVLAQLGTSITECPYSTVIKNEGDFLNLSDLCSCNCAILMASAEQLLGTSEATFLKYFCKYASPSRVLVVISKLDIIPSGEVENVLRYAESKLMSQFPGVRCAVVQDIPREGLNAEQWLIGIQEIISAIQAWTKTTDESVQAGISYTLEYISALIRKDQDALKKKFQEQKMVEQQNRERLNQKKELDQAEAERVAVDFQRRQYAANDKIRKHLENSLNQAGNNLFAAYKKAKNKKAWCETELEKRWNAELAEASKNVEQFAGETMAQDLDYLSQQLPEQIAAPGKDFLDLDRAERAQTDVPVIVDYSPCQQWAYFVGICGGWFIGSCWFNFIGTAMCMAGGALGAWAVRKILNAKSEDQDARVKRCIVSSVTDMKKELSQQIDTAIKEIYETVLQQFICERNRIIDARYVSQSEESFTENAGKVDKLNTILQMIEEVQ